MPPSNAERGPFAKAPETESSSARRRHAKGSQWTGEQRRMVAEAELHVRRILTLAALVGMDLTHRQALWIACQHAHRAEVLLRAAA